MSLRARTKQVTTVLADTLSSLLPEGWSFVLYLQSEAEADDDQAYGSITTNLDHEEMVEVLSQILAREGGNGYGAEEGDQDLEGPQAV